MDNKHSVLIAEGEEVNRLILKKILSDEFNVIEADSETAALEILKMSYQDIAAVILDPSTPNLNGYEFMSMMSDSSEYRNIPILVATADRSQENESLCLKLGAWDFIGKPYMPDILRRRLLNIIGRSQASLMQTIRRLAERDSLTGLYNRSHYMELTRRMLAENPEKPFVLIRMDIDRFRMFNSFFGSAEGDRLMKNIGAVISSVCSRQALCTYGRMESDIFCICRPYEGGKAVEETITTISKMVSSLRDYYRLKASFGVYVIGDNAIDLESMYACATEAAKKCKDNYNLNFAYYDDSMNRNAMQEQRIINDMEKALETGQFRVYLQPKYSLKTGCICGAETLVRWIHPERGMISPSSFIPIFEKNGFILQLDYYMWEKVCILIKSWIDRGLNPAPISVNVSRISLYDPRIVERLNELLKKYDVPVGLFNLEITESAYMSHPDMMRRIIFELRRNGFVILMDDFGSGYSCLNTLKDIDVDILKIDMKFLPTGRNNVKSEKILASITRMAGWLGMPVVVEGVETLEQKDYLESIGCGYAQGYYFARPMPVEDYEELVQESYRIQFDESLQAESPSEIKAFWSSDELTSILLKGFAMPFAIYEYINGKFDIIRASTTFLNLFSRSEADNLRKCMDTSGWQKLVIAFENAVRSTSDSECECSFALETGKTKWFRIKLHYVTSVKNMHFICVSFIDATREKYLESQLNLARGKLLDEDGLLRGRVRSTASDEQPAPEDGIHRFTASEALNVIQIMNKVFDAARFASLDESCIFTVGENNQLHREKYTRFRLCPQLGRDSAQAADDNVFYLTSHPLKITGSTGGEIECLIEVASRIAKQLILCRADRRNATDLVESVRRKIYTDDLTSAYNRRYFNELLFLKNRLGGPPGTLALIMLDLCNFKQINDTYGHMEGDRILSEVSHHLINQVRHDDSVIRYGGDEFVIALINCSEAQVKGTVRRLYEAVRKICYGPANSGTVLEASIGYAYTANVNPTLTSMEKLIKKADKNMYADKRSGRQ